MIRELRTFNNIDKSKGYSIQSHTISVALTAVLALGSLGCLIGTVADTSAETIGYAFDESCGYVDVDRVGNNYIIEYWDNEYTVSFEELSAVEPKFDIAAQYSQTRRLELPNNHYALYHDVKKPAKKLAYTIGTFTLGAAAVLSELYRNKHSRK